MIAFEQHLLYTKKHLLSLTYHHLFLTTLPGHLPAVRRGIEGGALDAFAIHGVEERHVFALDVDPCTVATPWQHRGINILHTTTSAANVSCSERRMSQVVGLILIVAPVCNKSASR